MDLYFVQSATTDFYKPPYPLRSALYQQPETELFTDVPKKLASARRHYGQGVGVGDSTTTDSRTFTLRVRACDPISQ